MDPEGVFGSGPNCRLRSSKERFGNTSKPGNLKLPAPVLALFRLYEARSSFWKVGEKLWNSEKEPLLFTFGEDS